MTAGTPGHPAEPPEPPGLQAERTRLAWRRTTLAVLTVLLLGFSTALTHRLPGPALAALAVIALCWLGVLAVAYRRILALAQDIRGTPAQAPALLALLAVLIAALSAVVILTLGSTGAR